MRNYTKESANWTRITRAFGKLLVKFTRIASKTKSPVKFTKVTGEITSKLRFAWVFHEENKKITS